MAPSNLSTQLNKLFNGISRQIDYDIDIGGGSIETVDGTDGRTDQHIGDFQTVESFKQAKQSLARNHAFAGSHP